MPIFEQVAVNIREVVQPTRSIDWPLTFLKVQHAKETTDELVKIATVISSHLLNSISEQVMFKDIGIFSKQTEQNTNQK